MNRRGAEDAEVKNDDCSMGKHMLAGRGTKLPETNHQTLCVLCALAVQKCIDFEGQ